MNKVEDVIVSQKEVNRTIDHIKNSEFGYGSINESVTVSKGGSGGGGGGGGCCCCCCCCCVGSSDLEK